MILLTSAKDFFFRNKIFLSLFLFSIIFPSVSISSFASHVRYSPDALADLDSISCTVSDTYVKNDSSYCVFNLNFIAETELYLELYLQGSKSTLGNNIPYTLIINGKVISEIVPSRTGWQTFSIGNAVSFKKGENTICIKGTIPDVPQVSRINLFRAKLDNRQNVVQGFISPRQSIALNNRINNDYICSFNTDNFDRPQFPLLPSCIVSKKVKYTFYANRYYKKGERVIIHAQAEQNCFFSIDVYCMSNPSISSINIPSSSGYAFKTFLAPESGFYTIRARTSDNTEGTCNIIIDSQEYTHVPITCARINIPESNGPVHIFSCNNVNALPMMTLHNENNCVIAEGTYKTMGAVDINGEVGIDNYLCVYLQDDYRTEDFYDIYYNCPNLTNEFIFGNFNVPRTFTPVSASKSTVYNCFSWSVGNWLSFEDPTSDYHDALTNNQQNISEELFYDDYYMFNGFVRTDNMDEAVIALWGKKVGNDSTFLHASVRKFSSNDTIPHGYDWESKMGMAERIFHSEDMLLGEEYGEILAYYKPVNSSLSKSFVEKVADGDLTLLATEFTKNESQYISSQVLNNSYQLNSEFERYYSAWKEYIDNLFFSNISSYKNNHVYNELLSYCLLHNSVKYNIIKNIMLGDYFAGILLKDLNLSIYNNISKEVESLLLDKRLSNSPQTVSMNSSQKAKLLAKTLINMDQGISAKRGIASSIKHIVTVNSTSNVYLRIWGNKCYANINIKSPSKVTYRIFTLSGENIYNNEFSNLSLGEHRLESDALPKGIYIVELNCGTDIIIKKINIL